MRYRYLLFFFFAERISSKKRLELNLWSNAASVFRRADCCGGQHAAILTAFGEVYTWGRGGFGRLGHGDTQTLSDPKFVSALEGIECCQVACGFAYTAVVTTEGALYTWGAGENGRLGLGDVEDRHVPCHVEALEYTPIKEVFAGLVHTCVLTREGAVRTGELRVLEEERGLELGEVFEVVPGAREREVDDPGHLLRVHENVRA